jgi:hypothetical protein
MTMTMTNDEPNPPVWPDSVLILRDTEDADVLKSKIEKTQDSWNEQYATFTCDHHFSNRRHAILFAPGIYQNLDLEVGYYVQVAGLGVSPDDVQFHNGKGPYVPALNKHVHKINRTGTSLDTFWRSGENFANHAQPGMMWAVSQASPLRRVHVKHDLYLHDKDAYASGGHIANAVIDGHTHFGGQQQFLSRNVKFGMGASGGAWGIVYVGCENAPPSTPGGLQSACITTVQTHVCMEKPYVAMYDDQQTFQLRVPQASIASGSPQLTCDNEVSRDFSRVKVATTEDATSDIQAALDVGKDVVFTPGIYQLDQSLQVRTSNQVIIGLGLATLISPIRSPCIRVAPGTAGVRIAGVMLEAPPLDPAHRSNYSELAPWSLLEYGEEGVWDDGDPTNPGGLFDVFCRVGGGGPPGQRRWINIDTMIRIHSGNVIGDNLWLWRADHALLGPGEAANCQNISPVFYQTEKDEYNVDTGLEVNGNNVTIYGLAVEHTSKHQTVWRGENGKVFFYQCEFPYDVGIDFGHAGYRGYLIEESVKAHSLISPGIYSNFRNAVVKVDTAIEHPTSPGVLVVNPFTVHLDNSGTIASVVNGRGEPAVKKGFPSRCRT